MTTPHNTAASVNVSSQVFLNTLAGLTTLEVVTPPVNGILSSFTGTSATYTPTNGFVGNDTFTYRAKNVAAPSGPAPQDRTIPISALFSITVLAATCHHQRAYRCGHGQSGIQLSNSRDQCADRL